MSELLGKASACAGLLILAVASMPMRQHEAKTSTAPVPQMTLRVDGTVPVPSLPSAALGEQLRCDAAGNIYLRFYQPDNPFQAPIERISADGENRQTFSVTKVPGFENASINDFTVGTDGTVVLGLWGPNPREGTLVELNSDGTFDSDSTIRLGGVTPFQIGLFASGSVLVAGTKEVKVYKNQPPMSVPVTEVLSPAGHVISEVTLPGDVKPPKPTDAAFKMAAAKMPDEVTLGDDDPGSDGNIYLMRHFGTPVVYVIGPGGAVVRTMRLSSPAKTATEGAIMQYSAAGNRLAIPFLVKGPDGKSQGEVISVYDAESGERLFDYHVPARIGAALACYKADRFTFLGHTSQHQLMLQHASAY